MICAFKSLLQDILRQHETRSLPNPVWLVHQFKNRITTGDRVYLWECGQRKGIIGLAEALEAPCLQTEPQEQLPLVRCIEKFAGERFRVRLRLLKVIDPILPSPYLRSFPELAGLSIFRCPRGTNFRVSHDEARVLENLVNRPMCYTGACGKQRSEKRIVFA